MECKWSKEFRVQDSGFNGFNGFNGVQKQKTVQYSEKFFHFWKFVHYTEQFEHGAERMHTYAASFLLICENDAIVIVFFCLFVKLLCILIGVEGFKRCSLRFTILTL